MAMGFKSMPENNVQQIQHAEFLSVCCFTISTSTYAYLWSFIMNKQNSDQILTSNSSKICIYIILQSTSHIFNSSLSMRCMIKSLYVFLIMPCV